jgi:hypothetical protein
MIVKLQEFLLQKIIYICCIIDINDHGIGVEEEKNLGYLYMGPILHGELSALFCKWC